jgi:hypothetical protein
MEHAGLVSNHRQEKLNFTHLYLVNLLVNTWFYSSMAGQVYSGRI